MTRSGVSFAIVSLSQLIRESRWDPKFHLLLNELKPRVEELKGRLSAEAALALLANVPLRHKKPLMDLARSGSDALNQANIDRVCRQYPHLALAIMERNLGAALADARREIVEAEAALESLQAISQDDGDRSGS